MFLFSRIPSLTISVPVLTRVSKPRHIWLSMARTKSKPLKGLMGLPNELLALILGEIEKVDLKNARLTCRIFSDLAITSLFTTAVVSIFPTDLEVFTKISNHPIFSKYITTIIYYALEFRGDLEPCYAYRTALQLAVDLENTGCSHDHKKILERVFCAKRLENLDSDWYSKLMTVA